jgi:hypothetical protein
MYFSFWASPSGRRYGGLPLKSVHRMEEVESELEVRGTPVFMRLRRTLPMVTMRLRGG